jgi:hypothetical protein
MELLELSSARNHREAIRVLAALLPCVSPQLMDAVSQRVKDRHQQQQAAEQKQEETAPSPSATCSGMAGVEKLTHSLVFSTRQVVQFNRLHVAPLSGSGKHFTQLHVLFTRFGQLML